MPAAAVGRGEFGRERLFERLGSRFIFPAIFFPPGVAAGGAMTVLSALRDGMKKYPPPVGMTNCSSAWTCSAFGRLMTYLKTRAPFWKREDGPGGTHWVDARESDEAARERWE